MAASRHTLPSRRSTSLDCLAVLPGLDWWADRCRMFLALPQWGARVHVHSHNRVPADHPLRPYLSQPPAPGLRAKWRALRQAARQHATGGPRLIVHDLAVARTALFLRGRWALTRSRRLRNVLSLYSPSAGFFLGGKWLHLGGARVPLALVAPYLRRYTGDVLREWVSVRLVDGVIGVSSEIIADALRYYRLGDRQAAVIPSCVDTEFWRPASVPPSTPPGGQAPFLLFAGVPSRRKGVRFLLEAFARLRTRFPGLRLRMAGAPIPTDDGLWYEGLISRLGLGDHVDVLGHQDREQLRDQFRTARALVYPSLHEGSPRVVKEAAACGCPVVTFRIPGTEIVDPAGSFFQFAPLGDTQALADLTHRLLTHAGLREDLARRGREAMDREFSPCAIAGRTMAFYEQLFRTP